jgi:hypothetical protein
MTVADWARPASTVSMYSRRIVPKQNVGAPSAGDFNAVLALVFRIRSLNSLALINDKALNIFSETLYEECSYNCVQTWYCTVHFVCTDNFLLQELDLT